LIKMGFIVIPVVRQNLWYNLTDDVLCSANTERSTSSTSYVKVKEFTVENTVNAGSYLRFTFEMKSSVNGQSVSGVLLQNAIQLGVEKSMTSSTYAAQTQDLAATLNIGDTISLWHKKNGTGDCYVKNFQIRGIGSGFSLLTD